jgi:hypothetical protein
MPWMMRADRWGVLYPPAEFQALFFPEAMEYP